MEIILKETVEHLGRKGQRVPVKAGFFRNYLGPRKLAVPVTAASLKWFEQNKKKIENSAKSEKEAADVLLAKVNGITVSITAKAQDETLYGSISAGDIADALKEKGFDVPKRQIVLKTPIRQIGSFEVEINLHPEVRGTFTLEVLKG